MMDFWPHTANGWNTLITLVLSIGAVVYTAIVFLAKLDEMSHRATERLKVLEDTQAQLAAEPMADLLADPLEQEFAALEDTVRRREWVEKQRQCGHPRTVIMQVLGVGQFDYCLDCGAKLPIGYPPSERM
jgi:hypothetical protein